MKNIPAFLLLVFISIQVTAQKEYRPGYIVTHNKDTLHGSIVYRHSLKNHTQCRFRNHELDTVYSPNDILGYGFPNDVFFTSQVVEGEFAEVLILGQISLFQSGKDFYIHKAGHPYQLIDKGTYVKKDGREGYVNPKWKGVFNYWSSDCGLNMVDLNNFVPGHRSLVELVLTYNRCIGHDFVEYRTHKPWAQTELSIMAGVDYFTMNMRENFYRYYNIQNHYDFSGPSAGLQAIISSPRVTNALAVQTDINFFRSNSYSLHVAEKHGAIGYHESFLFLTNINGRLGLRYPLRRGTTPIYLFSGVACSANFFSADLYKENKVGNIISSDFIHLTYPDRFLNFGYSAALSTQRKFGKLTSGISLNYSMIWGKHNTVVGNIYPLYMSFKHLHRISLSYNIVIL